MAKAIMIQGTMSNAGKSLIAAGLCRIFMQDGYRTAPFKSQNMALNSYITEDGLEMGRAQVMQAEAAGTLPLVQMNPILLKPTTDMGSQVIVNGISRGNMHAKAYLARKKELIPVIKEAYAALENAYEIIVIEGAGSPAEINLKQDDIVNMGMAELADAPVLLVGDIDRGGVFAQLYGTTQLLAPKEKQRVKGLIINKFRGDASILDPGIAQIESLCQIPVVGVVPYMDVDIDDEDSLSERLNRKTFSGGQLNRKISCSGQLNQEEMNQEEMSREEIRIAVIRFPKIANFTDFSVFGCIPGVTLCYVSSVSGLGTPDMVILPGTKNTIADLEWMRQNGLEDAVLELAGQGIPVWGICGGYQMLGEVLEDPEGAEGEKGRSIAGMGLFPTKTVFLAEKTRNQTEGAFCQVEGIFEELSGKAFSGYEIHMGQTWIDRENGPADTAQIKHGNLEICRPLSYLLPLSEQSKRMHEDGWSRGNVYGGYAHGIFDDAGIAKTIVNALRRKKGLLPVNLDGFDYQNYRESQYNRLADVLRRHLDMEKIYRFLEEDRQEKPKKPLPDAAEVPPGEIEAMSFAQISRELNARGVSLEPETEMIVKRAIHATADFDYADNLCFSPDAVKKALDALRRKAVIVTDTNMAKAGINKKKAEQNQNELYCFMADPDVAEAAEARGCTRAAASMEKAAEQFAESSRPIIFAVGNAPTALMQLNVLIEEKRLFPALIIGVPVGFVHVISSKNQILARTDVPYIVAKGRKGGSNVAAAIVNALLYLL